LIYLLLSIAASSLIFVIFKGFERYKINTLHAIIVNYVVAATSGIIAYGGIQNVASITQFDWFYGALTLGFVFISVFNLMAITTQRSGLSVVSVATKMSVVIPILFGIFYYHEDSGIIKTVGIIMALIAVYLTSIKPKQTGASLKNNLMLPILVFIGSGIIDMSIKFLEGKYVAESDVSLFSATIFGAAGSIGFLIIVYQIISGKFNFHFKNIIAGIVLGVPNYFSIYFLVKALRNPDFESSTIFTLNNVAIVTVSTVLGILLFKERLISKNWIGIVLALISILLVSLS